MMSQNPDHQADQTHVKTPETTQQGVVPARSSGPDTQPKTHDSSEIVSEGSQKEQVEYQDPITVAFSSPYYDPFGEGDEKEVEFVSLVDSEGVATIKAYHSNGSHR